MSALGQKRTFAPQKAMSAVPPKADILICGHRKKTYHAQWLWPIKSLIGANGISNCQSRVGRR